jgi:hypothetical protein
MFLQFIGFILLSVFSCDKGIYIYAGAGIEPSKKERRIYIFIGIMEGF